MNEAATNVRNYLGLRHRTSRASCLQSRNGIRHWNGSDTDVMFSVYISVYS